MTSAPVPTKILLFGATGVIGKHILEQLINAKPAFEKIGIFTSPGTVESKKKELDALQGRGVDVVVGDMTAAADVKEAYQGKLG